MPWPSLNCSRPTLKSHNGFSPLERQPMYRSSTPNEVESPPTSVGDELKVPSPTALNFPYHSPLSVACTPPRPALIVPSFQLSPRSPDGSGRGLRYSELPKPKVPKVASRLKVQSAPAGNPGGGAGFFSSSSANAGTVDSASRTAAATLLRAVEMDMAELLFNKFGIRLVAL